MFSIKEPVTYIQTIKNSKFMAFLYPVKSSNEVSDILKNCKEKYSDANHVCYAYIINSDMKYNDDKEPNKTAGAPILNVLSKNNLNMVLGVVVRYFGGIKLGTGGLTRAYSSSIIEALNQAQIIELVEGVELTITFNYDNTKIIKQIVKDEEIVKIDYHDDITYIINCSEDQAKILLQQLELYLIKASTKKILIEKKITSK